MLQRFGLTLLTVTFLCLAFSFAQAFENPNAISGKQQQLKRYLVPEALNAKAIGRVAPSTEIRLSIGLVIPKSAELQAFIKDAYDPASPGYRKFLTPEEFTARFAPSSSDYQKVINWAKSQHLKVVRTHPNRLLLDVSGKAVDVERAVHVNLEEALREDQSKFYRPNREPSINLAVPVLEIIGLNDFERPKHHGNGSSPIGNYISADLRRAYLPGSHLSGAGQSIGILALNNYGYDSADVAAYRTDARLPPLAPTNVLVGSASGLPSGTSDGNETVADIELAMAMAPAASVKVYIGVTCNDFDTLLNQMAASSPLSLQNATSFSWCWGPNTLNIIDTMAGQGQSFFVPSGDSGGYTANHQSYDRAKVTVVGGTTLTMIAPGVSYQSEVPWDDPKTTWCCSSGGGVEFNIPIPSYQAGTIFTAGSGASTVNRNDPDVSMVAKDLYIRSSHPYANGFYGTSASVPLWAGFMALVNEQYAHVGLSSVGWASPAIWNIGRTPVAYAAAFNDIASGVATSHIPGGITHSAGPGYDLTTGWGTPKTALIDQMACVTVSSTGVVTPSTPPICDSLATSWGDPHITTFDGMLYDFQAAGDFLAVTTGPSFVVQVRQQWAPNWPNVAINKAVAMQMGETRVAVFLDPTRLVVNGKITPLDDGKSLSLPDGVEVARTGSAYIIKSTSGETVRAEAADSAWVGGDFLNLTVALRNPPNNMLRGIFGNRNGSVEDDIVTRDGTVLAQPVSFDDFYHRYADSMRIQPDESLFGENRQIASGAELGVVKRNAFGIPTKPFTVNNLAPAKYKPARAACKAAGVKAEALLDACTLDVAVLGRPAVAKTYTGSRPPFAVMQPGRPLQQVGCLADCKPSASKPGHPARKKKERDGDDD